MLLGVAARLLRLPAALRPKSVAPMFISGVDVYPTVLDALGVAFPEHGAWHPSAGEKDVAGRGEERVRLFDGVNHCARPRPDSSTRGNAYP